MKKTKVVMVDATDFNDFKGICFAILSEVKYKGETYLTHDFMLHQEIAISLMEQYGFLERVFKSKELYRRIKDA